MTSLFGFKARFVPRIETRVKRMTIRTERKRMPRQGDLLRLQHGSRFKPQLIGFATALLVEPVRILAEEGCIFLGAQGEHILTEPGDLDAFAVTDGFDDWADMRGFWRQTHPALPVFTGFRTAWGETFRSEP